MSIDINDKKARKKEQARIRQANRRARVRGEIKDETDVPEEDRKGFAPDKAQVLHNKRHSMVPIERYIRNKDDYYFFIKSEKTGVHQIIRRSKNSGRKIESYLSHMAALEEFNRIKDGRIDLTWLGYERHEETARGILNIIKTSQNQPIENYPQSYSFLLALEQVEATEFGGRRANLRYQQKLGVFRNQMYQLLREDELPDPSQPNAALLFRSKWYWVIEEITKKKETISIGTWKELFFLTLRVAEQAANLPKYAVLCASFRIEALKQMDKMKTTLGYSDSSKTGHIKEQTPRECIPIDHLRKLLDFAFTAGPKTIYPYIILSLSAGMRPEEVRFRLAVHRDAYLNTADGSLFYKPNSISRAPLLITKTNEKPKEDPGTSIVTRLILKNHDLFTPARRPDDFFTWGSSYRLFDDIGVWTERHLRTTCASMLAYCTDAEKYRASFRDVQYRLGHKTLEMAVKRYAKNTPSKTLSPERYLNFSELGLVLPNETKEISLSEGSNLWDLYLLNDLFERMSPYLKKHDPKKYSSLLKAILLEFHFQNSMKNDPESLLRMRRIHSA